MTFLEKFKYFMFYFDSTEITRWERKINVHKNIANRGITFTKPRRGEFYKVSHIPVSWVLIRCQMVCLLCVVLCNTLVHIKFHILCLAVTKGANHVLKTAS